MEKLAVVDRGRCVACGACIKICPKGALSIWKGCYAEMNPEKCVGCGLCGKNCPAECITVRERSEAE